MAEKQEFATLIRSSRGEAVVLLATFFLVIFRDLTEGILVGFALSSLLFLHRMAQAVEIDNFRPVAEEDKADSANGAGRKPYDVNLATDPDVMVVRISGAFFFGAAAAVGAALDRIGEHPKAYVIDLATVSVLDSTGAATIEGFVRKARQQGAIVSIAGATPVVRRTLLIHGNKRTEVRFHQNVNDAIAAIHERAKEAGVEDLGATDTTGAYIRRSDG
jgi:SulP family sulfate permease